MSGASTIEVEGVRILFLDFAGSGIDDAPRLLQECGALVRAQPLGSALTLTDFTGSHFDSAVTTQLREYADANKPYVKLAAVVGVTGIKRAIYRAVLAFTGRTNLVLCDTVEEARRVLLEGARAAARPGKP